MSNNGDATTQQNI